MIRNKITSFYLIVSCLTSFLVVGMDTPESAKRSSYRYNPSSPIPGMSSLSMYEDDFEPVILFGGAPAPAACDTLDCLSPVSMTTSSSQDSLFSPVSAGGSISSKSSSSSQSSKKRKPDPSAHNDSCHKFIDGHCEKLLSTPNLKKVKSRYGEMNKNTPRRTKASAAAIIAPAVMAKLYGDEQDLEAQNAILGQVFGDEFSEEGKLLRSIHDSLLSEQKRKASYLDVDHVAKKNIVYDATGKVIEVQGSHNLSEYDYSDIDMSRPVNSFVDAKGVIGFYVGDTIAKTVLPDFTAEQAISNLRHGRTIAQGVGPSKIILTKTSEDTIVASYPGKQISAMQPTQYPVYTIDIDRVDLSGNVVVGYFGKIKSDFTGADVVVPIIIPRDVLVAMMNAGKSLESRDAAIQFVDITEQINAYCASTLMMMQKAGIPGNVYAYGHL